MSTSNGSLKKNSLDWTNGGTSICYQQCQNCKNIWYFFRQFCPSCGHSSPLQKLCSGKGIVISKTVLHRAPDSSFRELVPYSIVLVKMEEKFVVMGHAESRVEIGNLVTTEIRLFHTKPIPYFIKKE